MLAKKKASDRTPFYFCDNCRGYARTEDGLFDATAVPEARS